MPTWTSQSVNNSPRASQINEICRASNIRSPVMLIDRILLIQIDLEKLVVALTLEVFVAISCQDPCNRSASRFTYEFNFLKLA
jgi:hypothetical protein